MNNLSISPTKTLLQYENTFTYQGEIAPPALVNHRIHVVDSQFETFLISTCQLAASMCNVPLAMVMIADNDTKWVQSELDNPHKSQVATSELPHELLMSNEKYQEINDTNSDLSHKSRTLVKEFPKYRFYAGAPFKLPLGEVLGNICVFGKTPNSLHAYQKDVLVRLADLIAETLVIRDGSIKQIRSK